MAPPFTLILSASQPRPLFTANACTAKASLASIRSISAIFQPAFSRHFLVAGTGPVPIISGATPALLYALMVPRIGKPSVSALARLASMTAAAPSFREDALPAVTQPSFLNTGRMAASFSTVVPARGFSSVSNTNGSPLRCGTSTGVISSLNFPDAIAASAFSCDAAAKISCSARLMLYSAAIFSAVMPMW